MEGAENTGGGDTSSSGGELRHRPGLGATSGTSTGGTTTAIVFDPLPTTSAGSGGGSDQPEVTKPQIPTTAPKTGSPRQEDTDSDENNPTEDRMFECNICLDTAKDAVVSHCGHLFCWPCLHQWLETRPTRQSCPVCKAAISRDKVIPLYGRGGSNVDPRSKVPPRPTPTRQEQPEGNRFSFGPMDGGPGFHMSFGIGAFPFGWFWTAFGQPGNGLGGNVGANVQQPEEYEFLSKIFLWVALVFMVWLFLA